MHHFISFNPFPAGQILNMSNNKIKGSLSLKISYMTNLVGLDLSRNLVTGTIPSTLTLLTKLTYLDFSDNKITVSYRPWVPEWLLEHLG